MASNTRISLEVGGARLELEGEAAFVEKQLKELLPLLQLSSPTDSSKSDAGAQPKTDDGARRRTLKGYLQTKSPKNVYEAIAVVLHYKRTFEKKEELEVGELRDGLRQGGHRPPEAMGQALVDCRRKYGFIDRGSSKGKWKLTNQGETLVEFDLPRTAT